MSGITQALFAHAVAASGPLFVAGGAVVMPANIPVSTSGAQVGDLIILVSAYNAAMTLPGTGWSAAATYTWYTTYTGDFRWKVLTSTTDFAVTGVSFEVQYMIYRGITSVAKVVGNEVTASTHPITWPSPAANCVGQVMMMHQQATADPTAPVGYNDRYYFPQTAAFSCDGMDIFSPAAGTVTVTTINPSVPQYINGIELLT